MAIRSGRNLISPLLRMNDGLTLRNIGLPLHLANFKLIAFDMDSTLINIECVDEIADAVGRKAEVAAITEAAMRGEIGDFQESLRRRLALLQGVTLADIDRMYEERLQLNPGASELISACKAASLKVLLVSGGFTLISDRIVERLGIDFSKANQLEVQDQRLTGRLVRQSWGEICDGEEKKNTVLALCAQLGISPSQAIAVGDGANDLPMMTVVGLSVGYHAKPVVRERANVCIDKGGLDRLLSVFA